VIAEPLRIKPGFIGNPASAIIASMAVICLMLSCELDLFLIAGMLAGSSALTL
jgi:hypothetical protein